MYFNSESILYIGNDSVAQFKDFLAGSPSVVYKYECLVFMNTGMSEVAAFPSALLYHPSGRNLYVRLVYYIMWDVFVFCQEFLKDVVRHYRVLEETSCIA